MRHANCPITLTNRRRRMELDEPREWFDGGGLPGEGDLQGREIMLIMQTPPTDELDARSRPGERHLLQLFH